MTERLNLTELAAEHRMANGRASKLLNECGVLRDGRKLYDAKEARAVLSAAIDPAIALGNRVMGRAGTAVTKEVSELAAARLETERARTIKVQTENDIRSGKLIERAAVDEAGEAFAITIRTSILAVPSKIASRLVGKTRDQIASAIDSELRHALTDLADVSNYILRGAA